MHYLIVGIVALTIGTVVAVVANAIEHLPMVVCLAWPRSGCCNIRSRSYKDESRYHRQTARHSEKKRDEEKSNAKIIAPTEEQIRAYGGVGYRQVTRKAHEVVNQQERIDSIAEAVVNVQEERLPDEPGSK